MPQQRQYAWVDVVAVGDNVGGFVGVAVAVSDRVVVALADCVRVALAVGLGVVLRVLLAVAVPAGPAWMDTVRAQ